MRTHLHLTAVLILAASAGASQAACFRCEPIANVIAAPVAGPASRTISAEEVRGAIIRAGVALGWQIREEGPGKLVGTLQLRRHTAVVDIPYAPTTFSIIYKSSIELDAVDGQIHKNYNSWVSNLKKGIYAQLMLDVPPALTPDQRVGGHRYIVPPATSFARADDVAAVPLGEKGRARYEHYLRLDRPKAFAITERGGWFFSAKNQNAMRISMEHCQKANVTCWLYAVDDRVVWKPEVAERFGLTQLRSNAP